MNQGDIIKVNFDPTYGHEQSGYRPALIISNSLFNERVGLSICCPITSVDKGYPVHIPIPEGEAVEGVIMCDQVRTLDLKTRKFHKVGELSEKVLEDVLEIIVSSIEKL